MHKCRSVSYQFSCHCYDFISLKNNNVFFSKDRSDCKKSFSASDKLTYQCRYCVCLFVFTWSCSYNYKPHINLTYRRLLEVIINLIVSGLYLNFALKNKLLTFTRLAMQQGGNRLRVELNDVVSMLSEYNQVNLCTAVSAINTNDKIILQQHISFIAIICHLREKRFCFFLSK